MDNTVADCTFTEGHALSKEISSAVTSARTIIVIDCTVWRRYCMHDAYNCHLMELSFTYPRCAVNEHEAIQVQISSEFLCL